MQTLGVVWGVGQALWTIFWFFLFVMWIMLLFRVFADVFRSSDLSGVAKVLWILLVIITPFIGVFLYLIIRGGRMAQREVAAAEANEQAFRSYVRDAAGGGGGAAGELAAIADLRDRGVIDDAEFARLKAKIVG